MGRNRTGAVNEYSSIKLRLNTLIGPKKRGLVELNRHLVWSSNGKQLGRIYCDIYLTPESRYVRFHYLLTNSEGVSTKMEYYIWLDSIPSNLGIGENLFFICPIRNERCKILYLCDYTGKFCSRQGCRRNILYTSQIYSKIDRINNYYFQLDTLFNELASKQFKDHYRNHETRLSTRIRRIGEKRDLFDERRLNALGNSFWYNRVRGLLNNEREKR